MLAVPQVQGYAQRDASLIGRYIPLLLGLSAPAREDKPVATQLGEAVAPLTKRAAVAYTETMLK